MVHAENWLYKRNDVISDDVITETYCNIIFKSTSDIDDIADVITETVTNFGDFLICILNSNFCL